jgi:RNA polymerase sigma-70 factor (ECF subfamily)
MTDAELFEAFVRRHQDMVYATAVRLLGNPAEAEDVSQSVFLKAFQRFAQLRESPAAPGWLRTVARNECLNHLSRYRARWRAFGELAATGRRSDDEALAQVAATDVLPDHALQQAEETGRLEQALRRLPDHQRVPLVLYHFEDLSYQRIADTLGVSIGKVKTDIHRGREALRRELKEDHGAA